MVWSFIAGLLDLFAGKVAAGTIVGSLLGDVVHLSFCSSDERVAACSGVTVYILSSEVQDTVTYYKGSLCCASQVV